ncbi:YWTD domain-containing protein [Saccharata proteae CBS 121410]|uniref:YWTD domain-containing protein n=1 Tax=Saccharata proteae CBS 121410 TaxID=1314787 RepID=A0A9P4HYD3_9PEZI|nr:YWTD domain-containing protein [Saccharata proteae CBS 121410]
MSAWTLPTTANRPIAILGAGVLGRRIAAMWQAGGFNVHIRDPSVPQLEAALAYCAENRVEFSQRIGKTPGTVHAFESLSEAVKEAWMVIEAVPESLPLKVSTFAELDAVVAKDCILCSNSSSYRSSEMLDKVAPESRKRVLNMHYYMPPAIRIVELMTSGQTYPEIFPFLTELLQGLDMFPVTVQKECTGFLFNRVWAAIKREVLLVLQEGVSDPATVDTVWKKMWGSDFGPCQMMDGVGLDTVALIEDHYVHERKIDSTARDYVRSEFVSKGKLGNKSALGGLYPPSTTTTNGTAAPAAPASPTLYFLDVGLGNLQNPYTSGRILSAAADGSSVKTIVSGEALPDGIDICRSNNRLYWTNMGVPSSNDGGVRSCALDGTSIATIIPVGAVHTPKQLCIDSVNEKIYFSDREGMRVMRCNLDGSGHETLIQTGDHTVQADKDDQTNWCVGIAVDPATNHFYWTQKGFPKMNRGRIFRANMTMPAGATPTNRPDVECLFQGLPEPIDLEVDEKTQTLYWTDRGEVPFGNSINRASVAAEAVGKEPRTLGGYEILTNGLHEAIGLKLDLANGHVYCTDLGGAVYRFNVDGKEKKRLYESEHVYTGITLV